MLLVFIQTSLAIQPLYLNKLVIKIIFFVKVAAEIKCTLLCSQFLLKPINAILPPKCLNILRQIDWQGFKMPYGAEGLMTNGTYKSHLTFLKNWVQQLYTFYTFHFRSFSLIKIQNKHKKNEKKFIRS
jgi:hypothetical protein